MPLEIMAVHVARVATLLELVSIVVLPGPEIGEKKSGQCVSPMCLMNFFFCKFRKFGDTKTGVFGHKETQTGHF